MLSPVIFFNLVLETIHGFQIFTSAFVHQRRPGRPGRRHPVYTLYLYLTGFADSQMGYASALAWVFLAVDRPADRGLLLAPAGSGCTTPTEER